MKTKGDPTIVYFPVVLKEKDSATSTRTTTTTASTESGASDRHRFSFGLENYNPQEEEEEEDEQEGNNPDNNHDNKNKNNNQKDIVFRYHICCCFSPTTKQQQQKIQLNHNVFVTLVSGFTYGLAYSLWREAALSAYLNKVYNGRNIPMGRIEASKGWANLLSAIPVGYLADNYGRARIIRIGSVLTFLTITALVGTMLWMDACGAGNDKDDQMRMSSDDSTRSMILLSLIMSVYGVSMSIADGPTEALFADSVPSGGSIFYQYAWGVYLLATIAGPVVSILLFQSMGNEWNLRPLQTVIFIGVGMECLTALVMMFYNDQKALDEGVQNEGNVFATALDMDDGNDENELARFASRDALLLSSSSSSIEHSTNESEDSLGKPENTATAKLLRKTATTVAIIVASESNFEKGKAGTEKSEEMTGLHNNQGLMAAADCSDMTDGLSLSAWHEIPVESLSLQKDGTGYYWQSTFLSWLSMMSRRRHFWVPYVMFASSFISSVGSGVTVNYVPLYFKDDCGMTPTQVQLMYVVTPISMTIFSMLAHSWSVSMGRVPIMLVLTFVSLTLFYVIASLYHSLQDQQLMLVVLFVVQTGIGQAVHPLAESLLMDAVPRNQRARWRTLQSISEYGWSGAAVLGGFLSDRDGGSYQQAFFVSCYVQIFALLVLSMLLFLVPQHIPTVVPPG
ncbi:hypothetical protein ACA910_020329 [Epithemia clementina (nom. ined.)]